MHGSHAATHLAEPARAHMLHSYIGQKMCAADYVCAARYDSDGSNELEKKEFVQVLVLAGT